MAWCAGMEALQALAEQMGCPVAVQFSAKSMFPETHPQFLGVYCAAISSPGVLDRLTSADVIIAAGTMVCLARDAPVSCRLMRLFHNSTFGSSTANQDPALLVCQTWKTVSLGLYLRF